MNFIEEYKQLILDYLPVDPAWAEAISVTALAGAVGRKFRATSLTGLGLNVFYIAIGPSRLGYKTLPLKNFLIPTLSEIKRDLPASFTVEGMIEFIKEKGQREGVIVRDEVSTLFKEPKYNEGLMEFLSQMYSGRLYKRYTRKAKLEDAGQCWISFIGATTPYVFEVLQREHFVQGLGNRILWLTAKGLSKKLTYEELFMNDVSEIHKLQKRLNEKTDFLRKITQLHNEILVYPDPSNDLLTDYSNKNVEEANKMYENDPRDLLAPYVASSTEFAIKLASLRAIGDLYPNLDLASDEIFIVMNEEHQKWAIERVEFHKSEFEKVINKWRTRTIDKPVETDKNEIDFLLTIAKEVACPKTNKISINQVVKRTGWYHHKAKQKLLQLAASELIKAVQVKKRNRTEFEFYLK